MNRTLIASAVVLLLTLPATAQEKGSAEKGGNSGQPVPAEALVRQVPASQGEISLSFAPLVKETAPAVVNVYAARQVQTRSPFAGDPFFEQFFGRGPSRPRMESSLGSGVIVDASGVVVTNNHVIDGADEVRVALADGREFDAKILLKDQRADLAVLKVDADESFPVVRIADSDSIEIGDLVLAIGNPFGIGQTVTNGIVSALARTHIGANDFGYFIQTDAAINPGNSGGALIDMRGQLIGVNTAIFSRSGGSNGIGFAIPSNMVRTFVAAAMNDGRFERPYVGASFLPVTPDIGEALGLPRPAGALVQAVTAGGPAEKAGLKAGDVVLAMNGFTIENPDTLGYRLATSGLGKAASFRVATADGERDISMDLVAAPETPARDLRSLRGSNPFAGATVGNLSPKLADELQLPQSKTGVVVTEIARGAPAMRVGLQPKDIIVAVNGEDVESTEQLERMLAGREWEWQFEVERDGKLLRQTIR
jgi:Do/DeqQ family serine protease